MSLYFKSCCWYTFENKLSWEINRRSSRNRRTLIIGQTVDVTLGLKCTTFNKSSYSKSSTKTMLTHVSLLDTYVMCVQIFVSEWEIINISCEWLWYLCLNICNVYINTISDEICVMLPRNNFNIKRHR